MCNTKHTEQLRPAVSINTFLTYVASLPFYYCCYFMFTYKTSLPTWALLFTLSCSRWYHELMSSIIKKIMLTPSVHQYCFEKDMVFMIICTKYSLIAHFISFTVCSLVLSFRFVSIELVSLIRFLHIWHDYGTVIKEINTNIYDHSLDESKTKVSAIHLNGIWHLIWCNLSDHITWSPEHSPRVSALIVQVSLHFTIFVAFTVIVLC